MQRTNLIRPSAPALRAGALLLPLLLP